MTTAADNADTSPVTVSEVVQAALNAGLILAPEARTIAENAETTTDALRQIAIEANRPLGDVERVLSESVGVPILAGQDQPFYAGDGPVSQEDEPREGVSGDWNSPERMIARSLLGPFSSVLDGVLAFLPPEQRTRIMDTMRDEVGREVREAAELGGIVSEWYGDQRRAAQHQDAVVRWLADNTPMERRQILQLIAGRGMGNDALEYDFNDPESFKAALLEIGLDPTTVELAFITARERVQAVETEEAELDERREAQIANWSEEERGRFREYLELEKERPGAYYWDNENRVTRWREGVEGQQAGAVYIDPAAIESGDVSNQIFDFANDTNPEVAPWFEQGVSEEEFRLVEPIGYEGGMRGDASVGVGTRDQARFGPSSEGFFGGFDSTYRADIDRQTAVQRSFGGFMLPPGLDYSRDFGSASEALIQRHMITGNRPIYEEEANWSLFAGKSPEFVEQWQQKLIDAGAVQASQITMGEWGLLEAAAIGPWMTLANGKGETLDAVYEEFKVWQQADNQTSGRTYAPFTPPAYRSMDPATMSQDVKQLIRTALQRDPTDEEIASLGDFLAEQHREAYVADVSAARREYDAARSAQESGATYAGSPGTVGDVDYESRFLEHFEDKYAANLEFNRQGQMATDRKQIVGGALDNLLVRLGGGIGRA